MKTKAINDFLEEYVLPADRKVAARELQALVEEAYEDGREDERGRTWEL